MIVRRFLAWSQTVPASERAVGATALAEAYLYSGLSPEDHREAELALTALIDDPSPAVRRALCESLAFSPDAPYPVILALACDQSDISARVLSHSPILADGDLIECAAGADAIAQAAIALRPDLSARVSAALAEIGEREAVIALAVNLSAAIPAFAMQRMIQRFGDEAELREALNMRPDLPSVLRHDLVVATASALSAFASACGWLQPERARRAAREACDRSALIIAADAPDGAAALVRHLRGGAHLTPSLLLRSLLGGDSGFLGAAFADLAEVEPRRVVGLMAEPGGSGFAALYRKAGLPEALLPAFRAGLAALRRLPSLRGEPRLKRELARIVIEACAGQTSPEMSRCLALLRRFELEAAREDAQIESQRMLIQAQDEQDRLDAPQPQLTLEPASDAPPPAWPPVLPDLGSVAEADRIQPRAAA